MEPDMSGSGFATGTVRHAGTLGALVALGAAMLFVLAASGFGSVARYGGAVWVFILTWIILMPVLAPWLKEHRAATPARGDRILGALVVVAGATFGAVVLWLLLGSR